VKQPVPSSIEEMLRSVDPQAQPMAKRHAELLAARGVRSVRGLLIAATDSAQPRDVRAGVVESAFRRSVNPILIWEGAIAMAMLALPSAGGVLSAALLSSRSKERRTAAAYALGLLGEAKSIPPLTRRLQSRGVSPRELAHVIEALGLLKAQSVMALLAPLLKHRSPAVRVATQYAVHEIRGWTSETRRSRVVSRRRG
jgi:HEAT repeat protein